MRYVVVDLNILESGTLLSLIDPKDQIVLTDAYVAEVAKIDDPKRLSIHITKFPKWAKKHHKTIWVAHQHGALIGSEESSCVPTYGMGWRNDSESKKFKTHAGIYEFDMAKFIKQIQRSESMKIYNRGCNDFVEFCKRYRNYLHKNADAMKKLISNFEKEAVETVRIPALPWELSEPFLCGEHNPAHKIYRAPFWHRALSKYPDIMCVGRLARITAWYAMVYASNRTHKFENNYGDMIYGLTSSYTGFLATDDKGLKKMMDAVFGKAVKILSNVKSTPPPSASSR